MSTTLVETSPVWVYKLFSENSSTTGQSHPDIRKKSFKEPEDNNLSVRQLSITGKVSMASGKCSSNNPNKGSASAVATISSYNRSAASNPGALATITSSVPPQQGNGKFAFICNFLRTVREPLANYQEQRGGIPRDEEHSFIGLMTALFQATYHAILTIVTMLINLMPLVDGFALLARFMLDKSLDICRTESKKEKAWKALLFVGELIIIFLTVMLMFCLVLLPVWHLITYIFAKIWSMVFSAKSS